jgi:hypothetical protein
MKQTITLPDDIAQPAPQTMLADVVVPLTQNVIGGVATSGLLAIAWRAVGLPPSDWWIPVALAGSAVACVVTLTRFFADDIGITAAAYNAGRRSRDVEVNALHLQLRENADAMTMAGGAPTAATLQAKQLIVAQATLRHAKALLQTAYSGDNISRTAMEQRGIGQRDWERAMRLCRAAGVIDELNQLKVRDHRQALKAIEALHGENFATMQQRNNYRPAWY